MIRHILSLLLVFVLVGTASAGIVIRDGHSYTFTGFLILLDSPVTATPYVALSAHAHGIHPPTWVGHQDLALYQTAQTDNLLKLARQHGPTRALVVRGIGYRGGLKVSSVTVPPAPEPRLDPLLMGLVVADPVFGTPPPHPVPPQPVSGVKVTVRKVLFPGGLPMGWTASRVTGADGEFRFVVPARFVRVRFEARNYATVEEKVDLKHVHAIKVLLRYNGPPVPTPPPPHGR